MEFEWNEEKNQSNLIKHGIPFEQAKSIFDDPNILTFRDSRVDYGETRLISIGQIFLSSQDKIMMIVVVHTQRRNTTRIISARKANEREKKRYEKT